MSVNPFYKKAWKPGTPALPGATGWKALKQCSRHWNNGSRPSPLPCRPPTESPPRIGSLRSGLRPLPRRLYSFNTVFSPSPHLCKSSLFHWTINGRAITVPLSKLHRQPESLGDPELSASETGFCRLFDKRDLPLLCLVPCRLVLSSFATSSVLQLKISILG